MRALPRGLRYRAAAAAARTIAPLVASRPNVRRQLAFHMDSAEEIALSWLLEAMTRSGTAFDPLLEVEGADLLDAALVNGRGMLLVSAHAVLSTMVLRCMLDRGRIPAIITSEPFGIPGTDLAVRAIPPVAGHLFRVRTALRAGEVVGAMVDVESASARAVTVQANGRKVRITPELFRLAARCGAAIVFVLGRLRPDGHIVVTFGRPATAETAEGEFLHFVRKHLEGKAASGPDCDADHSGTEGRGLQSAGSPCTSASIASTTSTPDS